MNVYIRPSNGRWQVMWDIGSDPVTGKRRRRSKTVDTKAQAERLAREVESDLAQGWVDDGRMTVAELVEMFIEGRRHRWEPTTENWYRQKLAYLTDAMGHRRVGQVNGGALTVLYGRLLEKGLSPTSVHHVHNATGTMFRTAMKWGVVRTDPTARAEAPSRKSPEMATWRAEHLEAYFDKLVGSVWHLPMTLLAMTGMRRGEVAGLKWGDITDTYGAITISRTIKSINGKAIEGPPKTTSSRRTIALDEDTETVLRAHRAEQVRRRLALGPEYGPGDWIVVWEDGRPIHPDLISKAHRRISDRLGLPRIRLHDLRHTWATMALEAGVSARVVAEHLGHSNTNVTLNTYTHVSAQVDREAAELVARRLRDTPRDRGRDRI